MQDHEDPPSNSEHPAANALTLDDVLELHYRLRLFPLALSQAQLAEFAEQ
jgi:hypothetical protein